MKKIITLALLVIPILTFSQESTSKKVLMVLSSYGKTQGTERPGYEFDEFTQAYLIFKNNGLEIDISSPKGGKVIADKYNVEKSYNKEVFDNTEIMNLLDNTIPTANINANQYDAIYIVGGKGAMFDLPFDPSLQDIIVNLYQREHTVISSVCHGPAVFANVKDGDNFIIKDVEITGFCNVEEDLFGKKWVKEFPFKLEDKLTERGAKFSQNDFMLSHVAVDGKFVTGQNPFSTTKSAEEVVKKLGIKPTERTFYKDEKSIYFIEDIINNIISKENADKELTNNTALYDIDLIAVYGYYKMLAHKDDKAKLLQAIKLVEIVKPHFYNENLQLLLAKTYISINDRAKAKTVLEELISKNLKTEEANKLLKEIE